MADTEDNNNSNTNSTNQDNTSSNSTNQDNTSSNSANQNNSNQNNSDANESNLVIENNLFADDNAETKSTCILDLDLIVIQLHFTAAEKALAKNSNIQITNSAVDGKDISSAKFIGAGHNIIMATPVKKEEQITNEEALASIKEYVQWFAGPDIVNNVTADKLYILPTEKDNNDNSEKNESFQFIPSFLSYIVEDNTDKNTSENTSDDTNNTEENSDNSSNNNDNTDSNTEDSNNKDEKTSNDNQTQNGVQKASNWYITYNLIIKGKQEHSIEDAFKQLGKNILRNFGVSSFDWKTGNVGDVHKIGDVLDSFDKIFGKIDPDELRKNVINTTSKKFPGSNPEIEILDTKSIIKFLRKKLDSKALPKLKEAELAVTFKVNTKDKSYKLYNQTTIANIITDSVKGIFKKIKNKVTPDMVILVSSNSKKSNESILQNYIHNIILENKECFDNITDKNIYSMFKLLFESNLFEAKPDQLNKNKTTAIQNLVKNYDVLKTDNNFETFLNDIFVNQENQRLSWTKKDNKKYGENGFDEFYKILTDKSLKSSDIENKLTNISVKYDKLWSILASKRFDSVIDKLKPADENNDENSNQNKRLFDYYIIPMKNLSFKNKKAE